jgi:hypothetical protein
MLDKYDFDIDDYTIPDMSDKIDGSVGSEKYKKLSEIVCEILGDYPLVHFTVLNITDKESMSQVLEEIDNANSYRLNNI